MIRRYNLLQPLDALQSAAPPLPQNPCSESSAGDAWIANYTRCAALWGRGLVAVLWRQQAFSSLPLAQPCAGLPLNLVLLLHHNPCSSQCQTSCGICLSGQPAEAPAAEPQPSPAEPAPASPPAEPSPQPANNDTCADLSTASFSCVDVVVSRWKGCTDWARHGLGAGGYRQLPGAASDCRSPAPAPAPAAEAGPVLHAVGCRLVPYVLRLLRPRLRLAPSP